VLLVCVTRLCRVLCRQVRFLDVASAIQALARTAGEQLTVNLKKWSPAGEWVAVTTSQTQAQQDLLLHHWGFRLLVFPSCSAAAAAAEHIHPHSVELPRCPGQFLSLAFTTQHMPSHNRPRAPSAARQDHQRPPTICRGPGRAGAQQLLPHRPG
jgi:hypothetical protein